MPGRFMVRPQRSLMGDSLMHKPDRLTEATSVI